MGMLSKRSAWRKIRYQSNPSLQKRVERLLMRYMVYGVSGITRVLSAGSTYRLADRMGLFVYHAYPRLRRTALSNLQIAFGDTCTPPEQKQIARRSFQYICRTAFEVLRMRNLSQDDLMEWIHLHGSEHFDRALEKGKGVVLLTAHYGNWELMGARLSISGYPMHVIARDQRDTEVAKMINENRSRFGMSVIRRGETRRAIQCLRRNGILGILSDQHEVGGAPLDFFGRTAYTATGAARMALRTGAAVIPAFIHRDPENRHSIRVQPPLELVDTGDTDTDVLANTALMLQVIEREIASDPVQWLWVHRRWKPGQ